VAGVAAAGEGSAGSADEGVASDEESGGDDDVSGVVTAGAEGEWRIGGAGDKIAYCTAYWIFSCQGAVTSRRVFWV
jgi:hypothetical protein